MGGVEGRKRRRVRWGECLGEGKRGLKKRKRGGRVVGKLWWVEVEE